jgi:hypothetical protein
MYIITKTIEAINIEIGLLIRNKNPQPGEVSCGKNLFFYNSNGNDTLAIQDSFSSSTLLKRVPGVNGPTCCKRVFS